MVQIHVPNPIAPPTSDPASDIVVPTAALSMANIVDGVTSPPAYVLVPTFGKQSKARSKWISIGGADVKQDQVTPEGQVRFLFDGIETSGQDAGKIRTQGSTVMDLTPLAGEDDLAGFADARILPDGFTLELRGSELAEIRAGTTTLLSNDVYLRTPALLVDCAVRMRAVVAQGGYFEDFAIVRAVYDEGAAAPGDEALRITVTSEDGPLSAFNTNPQQGTTGYHLLPRFFRVVTGGLANRLPSTAFVRIRFQAAADNGIGEPGDPLTDPPWTSDIGLFNGLPRGALQFFRYEVEFDLDAMDQGITPDTEPVALDFLKIPFVF